MRFRLLYHPDVKEKDLILIPANIKKRLQKAIEERLLTEPLKYGLPLKRSLKGYRKLRVGDYRVIYRLEKNSVIILKIGHRKEIYSGYQKRIDD